MRRGAVLLLLGVVACGTESGSSEGSGGSSGNGGAGSGGVAAGGTFPGGGGAPNGGASASGGAPSGGAAGSGATPSGGAPGGGGAAGSGGSSFGDPFFAISPDMATWGDEQLTSLRNLGAGMVRLQFCDWPASQGALDAQVDQALAHGLHVYAELDYCTLKAYPDVQSWHAGFSDGGNQFVWDFAAAAGQIAQHFLGRVKYYELWNEPDAAPRPKGFDGSSIYWPDASNGDWDGACGGYAYGTPYVPLADSWGLCPRQLGALTTNAYMALKQADPSALVVAGNLLFHGSDAWVAKEYWKQVEASPAVAWFETNKGSGKPPWDRIGIHPYAYAPPAALDAQIQAFSAVVTGFGDGAPLAISEYGWHTNPNGGDPSFYASEATQAQYLGQTFDVAKQRGLSFVVWFNYLDAPNDALDFGVRKVSANGQPLAWKPAAKAYCQAAGSTSCPL